jgi:hypothetical protein
MARNIINMILCNPEMEINELKLPIFIGALLEILKESMEIQ